MRPTALFTMKIDGFCTTRNSARNIILRNGTLSSKGMRLDGTAGKDTLRDLIQEITLNGKKE